MKSYKDFVFEDRNDIPEIDPIIESNSMDHDRELSSLHYHANEDHLQAINDYTDMGSSLLNEKLIKNQKLSTTTKLMHNRLIDYINRAKPYPKELHVFSNTSEWDPIEHITKDNNVLHTPAFTSTSLSRKVAMKHYDLAGMREPGVKSHILHILLPSYYKHGAYLGDSCSSTLGEYEYLIKPKRKWNVIGRYHKNLDDYSKIHYTVLKPHEDDLT